MVFEGLLVVFSVTVFALLQLEAIRRADVAVVLHQAAFDRTRRLTFGVPRRTADNRFRDFLRDAFGTSAPSRATAWDVGRRGAGGSSVHSRFWSFVELPMKHHTEVTETCWFPF